MYGIYMSSFARTCNVLFILFLEVLLGGSIGYATKIPTANISLISNIDSLKEGQKVLVGVLIKLPEGWETFWRTPGEVGYGIKFSWEGSQNFKQADVLWPWPTRIKNYGFVANIYQNQVLFPIKIIPQDVTKTLALKLKLDYLLCNPTACVPKQAQLSLILPPGNAQLTSNAGLINKAIETIPKSNNTNNLALQDLMLTQQDDKTCGLQINVWSAKGFKDPQLFIEGPEELLFNAPEFKQLDDKHGVFTTQAKKNEGIKSGKELNALLNNPLQLTLVNDQESVSLPKTIADKKPATAEDIKNPAIDDTDSDYFIGSMMLFALLGGLILNLMPCVFPILSIKILTLHSFKNKRMHGVFYTLGVLFTFFIIALIILSLQSLGNMVGWGFQMQSPAFLILLIFLFTLISLNLFGFFEVPFSLHTNIRWQKTHQLVYAFGTGVLASVVTTPCSAPFMATAIGVAVSQGSWTAILIFLSLGFGFALPYLLLCWLPPKWAILPKPGAWMEKLKQFLGFPMILSVVWLLWVAGFQMSNDAVMMLLVSLCFLMMFFWLLRTIRPGKLRFISLIASLALIVYPLYWVHQEMTQKLHPIQSYEYSPAELSNLIKQNQKIFVYATAAWCITCKMNEQIAIETNEVKNFFNQEHVTVMKADWTNKNNAILQYLQAFKRAGVPLYIYYPPSGIPVILPQVLTPSTIINAIKASP